MPYYILYIHVCVPVPLITSVFLKKMYDVY